MDATASGAQLQPQGGMNLVSGMRRADGRRFKTVSMKLAGCVRGPARALARQARTAKSCGPDAPGLASSVAEMHPAQPGLDVSSIRKATVATVHGSPGRSRISRKPLCGESRMIRLPCGLLVRLVRTTAGAIGARLSPRPLFLERAKLMQNPGRIAPRALTACLYPSTSLRGALATKQSISPRYRLIDGLLSRKGSSQ